MKIKSKGSIWTGYRRLYLKEYGIPPSIEFQFNLRSNGLGISWSFETHLYLWLHFGFFQLCFVVKIKKQEDEQE